MQEDDEVDDDIAAVLGYKSGATLSLTAFFDCFVSCKNLDLVCTSDISV